MKSLRPSSHKPPTKPVYASGIVKLKSSLLFPDTMQRFLATFAEKGIKVFSMIDQQRKLGTMVCRCLRPR
jgi:uncharacterized protein (DUF302 family)